MSDRIRYQYENLEVFARKFATHAMEADQVRARLHNQLTVLENGGWLGEAARRFSIEMRDLILPALRNLSSALDGASDGLMRAAQMMREAEEEAAGLFRAVEANESPAAVPAAASGLAAGRASVQQVAALTSLRDDQTRFIQDLRRGMDGFGGQIASVQAAYDRLIAEAASRADRMTTLIATLSNGTAS